MQAQNHASQANRVTGHSSHQSPKEDAIVALDGCAVKSNHDGEHVSVWTTHVSRKYPLVGDASTGTNAFMICLRNICGGHGTGLKASDVINIQLVRAQWAEQLRKAKRQPTTSFKPAHQRKLPQSQAMKRMGLQRSWHAGNHNPGGTEALRRESRDHLNSINLRSAAVARGVKLVLAANDEHVGQLPRVIHAVRHKDRCLDELVLQQQQPRITHLQVPQRQHKGRTRVTNDGIPSTGQTSTSTGCP